MFGGSVVAALIRETLHDLARNRIVSHDEERLIQGGAGISWEYLSGWEQHCDVRCDIIQGLETLVRTKQVDTRVILYLSRYLNGETIEELRTDVLNVEELLIQALALLEAITGYDDEKFLDRIVAKYPKFVETRDAYRDKLFNYGRTLTENVLELDK